jgi:uncharacterized membrane protein
VQFALTFGGYVFSTWLSMGQNMAYLAVTRSEPAPSTRLFRGWPYVLTSLLAGLVVTGLLAGILLAILVPATVMGGAAGDLTLPMAMGIVASFVVVAYVALRFSQFTYFIVDQNAGVMDALRASWEATSRDLGTVFLLYAAVVAVNLAGFLCFVVGLILTMPFSTLMLAVGYLSLTGQPLIPKEPAPDSWDDEPDWNETR